MSAAISAKTEDKCLEAGVTGNFLSSLTCVLATDGIRAPGSAVYTRDS